MISSSYWGAQRMEELLDDVTLRTVFSAGNGEVEVYEITMPESGTATAWATLGAGCGCVPVAVTRGGKAMLPDADIVLQAGDILHLSATFEGIEGCASSWRAKEADMTHLSSSPAADAPALIWRNCSSARSIGCA